MPVWVEDGIAVVAVISPMPIQVCADTAECDLTGSENGLKFSLYCGMVL